MSIPEVLGESPPKFVTAVCGDEGDAGEDALSLCDLPLYSDAADYSFSSEDSSFGYDVFEFSSLDHHDDVDFPGPSPVWDSGDIVFCGKLIPTSPASNPYVGNRTCEASRRNNNNTGLTKNARVITYSSARSDKWYMLAFGLARFPSKMALSEIRRRQGKGNPVGANSCRSDSREIGVNGRTSGKKGGSILGMLKLKALGSNRRDAGAVVKASFGCFPWM